MLTHIFLYNKNQFLLEISTNPKPINIARINFKIATKTPIEATTILKILIVVTDLFQGLTDSKSYITIIHHQQNMILIYKHNAYLLKHDGNVINAGDPIAIVGESGELTTGPHLHFELWYNGTPVNPLDYMTF